MLKTYKILFTITMPLDPLRGGVQRTTYKLGRYFTEQGHEVVYYSASSAGHATVEYGRLVAAPKPGGQSEPENLAALDRLIASFQPDIVINQMPYEERLCATLSAQRAKAGFLLLACLRNSLFSVVLNPDTYVRSMLPGPLKGLSRLKPLQKLGLIWHKRQHAAALRRILHQHDHFVLLAEPNREELRFFIGSEGASQLLCIPNSIPDVKAADILERPLQALYVGGLKIPQKRADLLMPVWKQAQSRLPDWQFVLVGEGSHQPSIEQEIASGAVSRVRVVGRADPYPHYEQSRIFVMTSAFEGFPNVILEAQSRGLVPVAFDSYPALRAIVHDQQDAILIPPMQVSAMSDAIAQLAQDPERLARMSKAALANAQKYTIDRVGAQWLQTFGQLRA